MKKSIFAILTAAALTTAFAQTPAPVAPPAAPAAKTAKTAKKTPKHMKKSHKAAKTTAAPVQK